jgi:hypothetical protein
MRAARTTKEPAESKPSSPRGIYAASVTGWPEAPPWVERARPRGIRRVPTHTVAVPNERRIYARAKMRLSLRLTRIAGQRPERHLHLHTQNISSSGVYFLCPLSLEPGTPIELEVALVERPDRRGSVRMVTEAHVVRVDSVRISGMHGLAATFDDITFHRDDPVPQRYHPA